MSSSVDTAIVGTLQQADASLDLTGSAADELVAKLEAVARERAFLLRCGAHATLRRAARVAERPSSNLPLAATDSQRTTSARLNEVLTTLLTGKDAELSNEALERVRAAGQRLSPQLLPLALRQTNPTRRELLRPLLGARGRWMAGLRSEWSWALTPASTETELGEDFERRWAEGSAAERKTLLAQCRRAAPERARALVLDSFSREKVEQRLAWLEVLEADLSAGDESLLRGMASDRSAQVRIAAARLGWKLRGSAVAESVRKRATALVSFAVAKAGLVAKLKAAVGAGPNGSWQLSLPDENFDAALEREGIIEDPPQGVGRRQWWLLQLLSAVPPEHWSEHFKTPPAVLVEAAARHDDAGLLLDALSNAALRHECRAWYAPLWDVWMTSEAKSMTNENPLVSLTKRLTPEEADERGLRLLDHKQGPRVLCHLSRPWPTRLSRAVLSGLERPRLDWAEMIDAAALGIPVELLPESLVIPEIAGEDYTARHYVRALERFQSTSALRRSIAQETAS